MGILRYGLAISIGWAAGLFVWAGCGGADASPGAGSSGSASGAGGAASGAGGAASGEGGATAGGGDLSGPTSSTTGAGGGFGACATFSAEARQASLAMLIVLDRTFSMGGEKWAAAQDAIVQAIDGDVFDTSSLGLLTFPAPSSVPGPDCILNYPIYCDVSASPQVTIELAGAMKSSDAAGVRSQIAQYLAGNGPQADDLSDSSPIYAALNGAYGVLRGAPNVEKRVAVLITDGGGSCTSISEPARPGYLDGNGCGDWEEPPIMAKLIRDAHDDPGSPINTFIVGVPGSNSHGEKQGGADTPPYSMQSALSTYAVAGSIETLDPACDSAELFSAPPGADPLHPCHIDLSSGNAFDAGALADAITAIRGKALGCVYDLPAPPPGETIDEDQVNVVVTIDGSDSVVPRRQDASDACAAEPCWDYDASGRVELFGAVCAALQHAASAKVEIYLGCETILN